MHQKFSVCVRGCGSWEQPGSVVQVRRVFQRPAALTQLRRRNWSPSRDLCSLQSTGVYLGPPKDLCCTPDPPLWFSHGLERLVMFSFSSIRLQGLTTALVCGSVIPCLRGHQTDQMRNLGGLCIVLCFVLISWSASGVLVAVLCHVVPQTTDSRTGSSLEAAPGCASGKAVVWGQGSVLPACERDGPDS